ncbi:MAG: immune inhibitor A [Gammaproteobacteria bacterium]|nr:immune inhibitor A [Gammaproteobacteria bacterium]MDH5344219.1 immune inhibitor A [Gammaproteobacteria bacterium]
MNSHNSKSAFAFYRTPGMTADDRRRAKAVSNALTKDMKLAIADDDNAFCDPYNSTGRHVVLQARLRQGEN